MFFCVDVFVWIFWRLSWILWDYFCMCLKIFCGFCVYIWGYFSGYYEEISRYICGYYEDISWYVLRIVCGYFENILKDIFGYFCVDIFKAFCEYLENAFWIIWGYFVDTLWIFLDILRVFLWVEDIPRMFQGYLSGYLRLSCGHL